LRPINLIPAEERPGSTRPLRAGPLAYVVVGVLALALIGLTAMVVSNGQISDRKSEVAQLESEQQAANAELESLAAYTQFHAVREQRIETMTSLADSRFDWPRVMQELALVLPSDVHLTSLTASASPETGVSGGSGSGLRTSIAGPALELVGCAASQSSVGGFVDALKGIDGVTRVGVSSSAVGGSGESGSATASTCAAGNSSAQFQMTVAFDAAPVQVEGESGEATPPPAESSESSGESGSTESASSESSSGEGGAE
jgi:Tfp pilus assembly protein PilN